MSTIAGWEHFRRAEWEQARAAFEAALAVGPDDASALDGLGQSLWWLGDRRAGMELRREAYAAHQRAGNRRAAGALATYLAAEHRIDGRDAESAGWLGRAQRLLEGLDPGPEHSYLAVELAKRAQAPEEAEREARRALEIAHLVGDPDTECMALAQLGRALVRQGRTDEGIALLDEAMTVALSGESSDPMACSDACCTTLVVCESLADLQRATQWCEAVVGFIERRRFIPVQSWCRGIFGGVLVRAGDWQRADAVLTTAAGAAPSGKTVRATVPLAALAELRLRQGRFEEAATLLEGLEDEPQALAPLVRLRLARGEATSAGALLDELAARADAGLVALLHAEVALEDGRGADAIAAAAQARAIADATARPDLRAEADLVGGRAATLEEDDAAPGTLQAAVDAFAELGFPLEEARARLALAEVLAADSPAAARAHARAACRELERLGALPDAGRASALLRQLGASGRDAPRGERDELTAREREVLALLGAGLSNAEIAERLVIAPKTAEHHVGAVLSKLGVRNRAAAAAHAVRLGLER